MAACWMRVLGGYSLAWNYSVWAPTPVSLGYSGGNVVNPATGAVGARQNYPNYEPDPGNDLYPGADSADSGQLAGYRTEPLRAELRRTRWSPTAAMFR